MSPTGTNSGPDPTGSAPAASTREAGHGLDRARARAVPGGLLGMLALVAAVEAFVAHDVLDFSDPVSLNWRMAADDARAVAPGRTVLCVGDSLVKHGLIPRVIASRTGRGAVNLAVAQGPAPATYFLLRRALEAGARPSSVVVDFKPSMLAGGPRYDLRYWQEILTPRECLELARSARGASLFCEVALGRLLPTFRARHEVRSNLLAALRGASDPLGGINRTCWRNWTLNEGANVAAKNPAFGGEVGPDDAKKYLTHAFRCHRVNADFIGRFLALAESRGVRVYWLLPPLSPGLQDRRERDGAEAGYVRFVRALQGRHPTVTVLDARHAGYGHTLFVDASHLDGQGAYTLSRDVADVLRRDLDGGGPGGGPGTGPVESAGPRWLELPAYRDCPAEVALEDIEQSRRALGAKR